MYDDTLARRIRAYRKLKGLTQRKLAERLGISISIIGAIERGARLPDKEILERISDVLEVHKNDLMKNQENETTEQGKNT